MELTTAGYNLERLSKLIVVAAKVKGQVCPERRRFRLSARTSTARRHQLARDTRNLAANRWFQDPGTAYTIL
jgi:hypothetical protein